MNKRFLVGAVWTDGTLLNPVYKWAVYDTQKNNNIGGHRRATSGLFKTEANALKRAAMLEKAYQPGGFAYEARQS